MTLKRILLMAAIAAFCSGAGQAAEIWFSPTDPFWAASQGWPTGDYMKLFEQEAPWNESAKVVSVFEISKRFVLESSPDQVAKVIGALRQKGIKLSVQITPLVSTSACGIGVESHGPADQMEKVATKLKAAGAELSYVSMDEPLWFGHHWKGASGKVPCTKSIPDVAKTAATQLQILRKIYPQVVIGDIEPTGVPPSDAELWVSEITEWLAAYRQAMSEPLGFFTADVVWQRPTWRRLLPQIDAAAENAGIRFAIIYNGTPSDSSDVAWIHAAIAHYQEVEGDMHIRPARAVFESWTRYPEHFLPDSLPDTSSNLLLQYAEWQKTLKQ